MTSASTRQARSVYFSVRDGVRLHAACYEAPASSRSPVLCLAGLTRNGRDFHDLALALSSGPEARTVWTLDSRGRGLSDSDSKWSNYSILVEAHDVIDFAAMAGIQRVTIIGTSRGGLLAMVIAAIQPSIVGAVVLNDIGPVIERDGLMRIGGYVGRVPLPSTWTEAAKIVEEMSRKQFPAVPKAEWEGVARAWWNEKDGRPAPGFDPAIAKSVAAMGTKIPALWPQFLALSNVPVLVIRGEMSDILSAKTQAEMMRRHPGCAAITVPGQGHAPLLKDQPTQGAISKFIAAHEQRESISGRDFML